MPDLKNNNRAGVQRRRCSLKHPNILLTLGIGFQSLDDAVGAGVAPSADRGASYIHTYMQAGRLPLFHAVLCE